MSYWNSYLDKRISRRRALAVTAAGIGGTALLAACGGDETGGGVEGDSTGLLSKPVDTTSKAIPGGIWVKTTQDALGWDPLLGGRVIAITDSGYR